MDLKRRFTLYGFGFVLGIILVLFFLSGKRASCNFFPNERVLNMLRNKYQVYSEDALQQMSDKKIDSSSVVELLIKGDVDFSKSKVHEEPCRYYWIDGFINEKEASIYVQNCDSVITIQNIQVGIDP